MKHDASRRLVRCVFFVVVLAWSGIAAQGVRSIENEAALAPVARCELGRIEPPTHSLREPSTSTLATPATGGRACRERPGPAGPRLHDCGRNLDPG